MTENNYLAETLDNLLEKQIAFACWFYPRNKQVSLMVGNASEVAVLNRFDSLNGDEGFVFAPFRVSGNSPLLLLKPDFYSSDPQKISKIDTSQFEPIASNEQFSEEYSFQSKTDYLQTIDETVAAIQNGVLAKVIISRQIPVTRTESSLGDIFVRLNAQTPNAFTYLVNLPYAGTWMGATPEVFLRSEKSDFETVSLAGTQTRRTDSDYWWRTKDIEEQAFVSRYLLEVFFKYDIHQYTTLGPETLESGKVAHLKTSFFFPKGKVDACLGDFVAELHPTPAVCGLPKDEADEFIRQKELYHRKYYTGFLGPWRLNGEVCLFVNLRCMEVTSGQFILYAGGGITSQSVAEREWEETNQKAKTLLSVINPDQE